MVESIYFLKPAWCGNHFAGLWPEQGLQPVINSHRLQAVVCHSVPSTNLGAAGHLLYGSRIPKAGFKSAGPGDRDRR